jgi:hypothetical protein
MVLVVGRGSGDRDVIKSANMADSICRWVEKTLTSSRNK